MAPHIHSHSTPVPSRTPWIEQIHGDAWHLLRGRKRPAANDDTPLATELCGQTAEFIGLFGEDAD